MNSSAMRCALAVWLVYCVPIAPAQAADAALSSVVGNWLTEPRDGIIQVTVDAKGNLEGASLAAITRA